MVRKIIWGRCAKEFESGKIKCLGDNWKDQGLNVSQLPSIPGLYFSKAKKLLGSAGSESMESSGEASGFIAVLIGEVGTGFCANVGTVWECPEVRIGMHGFSGDFSVR